MAMGTAKNRRALQPVRYTFPDRPPFAPERFTAVLSGGPTHKRKGGDKAFRRSLHWGFDDADGSGRDTAPTFWPKVRCYTRCRFYATRTPSRRDHSGGVRGNNLGRQKNASEGAGSKGARMDSLSDTPRFLSSDVQISLTSSVARIKKTLTPNEREFPGRKATPRACARSSSAPNKLSVLDVLLRNVGGGEGKRGRGRVTVVRIGGVA